MLRTADHDVVAWCAALTVDGDVGDRLALPSPDVVHSCDDPQLLAVLRWAIRAVNQLQHFVSEVLGQAEDRGWATRHGRSVVDLGRELGLAPSASVRLVRNARRAPALPRIYADAADGRISPEVMDAAAAGMETIRRRSPHPLTDDQCDDYERVLWRHTMSGASPKELGALCRQIGNDLAGADPDAAPVTEDARLNTCEIGQTADGRTTLTADLDVLTGEQVVSALHALAIPRPDVDGTPDPRTTSQRHADALAELVIRAGSAGQGLPLRAQLVATVPADNPDLSRLSWAGPITARLAEHIACDADLAVAGLDGNGVPVSLGRTQRLFSQAQKAAMRLRDGGCIKCGAPPQWTDAHHIEYWEHGGSTDLDSGALLCRPCHRDVHHHGWQIIIGPDRHPWLKPPAAVDPDQNLIRSYRRRTLTLAA